MFVNLLVRGCVIGSLCCALAVPLAAKPVHVDLTRHTARNAAVRSALLPGWGQFFNDQNVKGWVVGGLFVVSACGYLYYTGEADKAYKDYEQRGLRNDDLYAEYESKKNAAAAAVLAGGGLWLLSVIDAYVFGSPRPDPKLQASDRRGLQLVMDTEGPSVRWSARF